ncbi:GtrA family protein [Dyadobacter sp. CY345]|uniref:GtrA family protein n=1 Tax=Dyadobacter sp. CY345 TaxID=2909335 RepID=UPI001F43CE48|nr:GtrA family protein [Dyadobacter sp. CY345]MCF2447445.1 GtrA family protein [Dyadobacter sp. CY345]
MLTFIKAQASSLTATFIDFSTTIVLVNFFLQEPFMSSVVGTTCGGLANFIINRYWVFDATENKISTQAFKYFLVWVGNLAFNASGMYLILHVTEWNYVVSKALVALVVGFGYNYVFQKKLVFR